MSISVHGQRGDSVQVAQVQRYPSLLFATAVVTIRKKNNNKIKLKNVRYSLRKIKKNSSFCCSVQEYWASALLQLPLTEQSFLAIQLLKKQVLNCMDTISMYTRCADFQHCYFFNNMRRKFGRLLV